ncbi:iron-containing alcohol dehydrogenase [Microbacterium trichothecenolyticum]|uniref:Iron-containing alcohol dehydrogenase n=1 Tax=Microbacterium ureisolvens TaxID=2781186 RepID=A0ABS7I6J5_9MICO|nr:MULTISPECIES: iron-containing alcohol dehydrogenase [Microbacterium]MBW9111899.1 iron-containing alcohol dehydrogenase [Microbacterium ureisolvens]MBW9122254.1 iron-containing alcohol dehydrogenase [Microbacterium trichothecenolyticum]
MTSPSLFGLIRSPHTVLLGRGQSATVGAHLPAGTRNVLIVTDERMAQLPAFSATRESIAERARTHVFTGVEPELPTGPLQSAATQFHAEQLDVIVAVGGGSCIDFAKVLALLLTHGGQLSDYYGEFAVPGPTLPVIAIPTTSGTGSEVTPVAVVSDPTREMKVGISSPHLIPSVAICDPALTDRSPATLTANVGIDALAHCIESYTSIVRPPTLTLSTERVFIGNARLTEHYALAGIQAIGANLVETLRKDAAGENASSARDELMLGSLCGGFALGTGGTAAAHALQYPVGGLTHTPHGLGIGVLLPFVMEFNRPARVTEFAQIARLLGENGRDDEELSHLAVDAVDRIASDIGIPRSLSEIGVDRSDIGWIAEQSLLSKRLIDNNPRELAFPALEEISVAAFEGRRARLLTAV